MPFAKINVPVEDNQVDWKTVALVGAGAVAVGGAAYLAYRHFSTVRFELLLVRA